MRTRTLFPWPHRIAIALGGLLLCPPPARADLAPRLGTDALPYLQYMFLAVVVAAGASFLLLLARKIFFPARSAKTKPFLGFGAVIAAIVVGLGGYLSTREMAWWRKAQLGRQELSNLGAIRSTEVAYFAEWNVYVGNQPFTPVANRAGNSRRIPWVGTTRFSLLGFAPEEDVYCSYSLEGPDVSPDGFTVVAQCDIDGDGAVAVYTITSASSETIKTGGTW